MSPRQLPIGVQIDRDRLTADTILCAHASHKLRGGFYYFTHPGGESFPTRSAQYLIRHGLVRPSGDAMLGGASQTYRLTQEH